MATQGITSLKKSCFGLLNNTSPLVVYQWVRSHRRTFALHLTPDGVQIRTPLNVSQQQAEQFLFRNLAWLRRQQMQLSGLQFVWQEGACFAWRGNGAVVHLLSANAVQCCGLMRQPSGEWVLSLRADKDIEQQVKTYLGKPLLPWLQNRVACYCAQLSLPPPRVRLSNARTRWGSCSLKSGLRFNWRLAHFPPAISDYVVAHEVAHLLQMNHSPAFWAVVDNLMPDWSLRRAALRALGRHLPHVPDWQGAHQIYQHYRYCEEGGADFDGAVMRA